VVQSEVINVSNLDLTFETGDGPVHALKNVDLKVNRVILYLLLDHLVVEKQLY